MNKRQALALRYAQARWLWADDEAILDGLKRDERYSPLPPINETVDGLAERYALDDPFENWGPRYGRPVPTLESLSAEPTDELVKL